MKFKEKINIKRLVCVIHIDRIHRWVYFGVDKSLSNSTKFTIEILYNLNLLCEGI